MTPELVRTLLREQFPAWADRAVTPVLPGGTDNAVFRLGDDLSVRLPRLAVGAEQVVAEQRWLPLLAPGLPLEVPVPVAVGLPGAGFPWPWSVHPWIDGENAPVTGSEAAGEALGGFLGALWSIDTSGGPKAGRGNGNRGVALSVRDADTRAAITRVAGRFDAAALSAVWVQGLSSTAERDTWVHGDLHPGNVLARDGLPVAVIDFGLLAVGDGACDLMAAWTLCTPPARAAMRRAVAVDEATWARGRAWALSFAAIAHAHYAGTGSELERVSAHTLGQLLLPH